MIHTVGTFRILPIEITIMLRSSCKITLFFSCIVHIRIFSHLLFHYISLCLYNIFFFFRLSCVNFGIRLADSLCRVADQWKMFTFSSRFNINMHTKGHHAQKYIKQRRRKKFIELRYAVHVHNLTSECVGEFEMKQKIKQVFRSE